MIFSHKKIVIFRLHSKKKPMSASLRLLLILFVGLFAGLIQAQEKEVQLKKSNDLVYEGNSLVSDDFVAAEKEYRKAISKVPTNSVGSYNLGNAYYNSGHYDEALLRHIEAAKNATDKTEKHHAYHNIGNVLMQQEMCQEAVEAFKNALRNDPTDDETRYNLALAKECAKNQGGGGGDDENEDEENKQDEQQEKQDQKDEGDQDEDKDSDGDEQENQNDGEDKEDDNGKPSDEKDNNQQEKPGDQQKKKQQPQPGKLSPQQVKNLLEAMNNQEKKVQEKINARKTKGVKVKTEKDW